MNSAARENSSLQEVEKEPFRLPASQRKKTRGGRGIISATTSERRQALMALVLYHKSTGLL